jgi:hypothetical protein
LRDRSLRGGHPRRPGLRQIGGELRVEVLRRDVQVGRAIAERDRPQRVGERAARVQPRERDGALAGRRCEAGDVDKPGDRARAGVDVRDHGAAVGVPDEHHRAVDRAHQVADGGRVGGEPAQRVGGGDHRVARAQQRIDHAAPARRPGEGTVDEHDGGPHAVTFLRRRLSTTIGVVSMTALGVIMALGFRQLGDTCPPSRTSRSVASVGAR